MKGKEQQQIKDSSQYCKRVNKIFSLGYIDLELSKNLVLAYLKATEEKRKLLDEEWELVLQKYTNGISVLNEISKSNKRISKNVLFFFWATIIGWVILVIYFFLIEN